MSAPSKRLSQADRDYARIVRRLGKLAEDARAAVAPVPDDRTHFLAAVLLGMHRMVVTHNEHRAQTDLLYRQDGTARGLLLTVGPIVPRREGADG